MGKITFLTFFFEAKIQNKSSFLNIIVRQKVSEFEMELRTDFRKLKTYSSPLSASKSSSKLLYMNHLGCVRRLGGKPARAEAAGDAAAKKRL
ncbi:MAG TPA: hypothetical protein GXZ40_01645 [Bacteroidales bacterium]|nr:hypothetical protein [Bacteroidales bacterium]